MELPLTSFCFYRSFICFHCRRLNWIKAVAVTLFVFALPCCKQKSPPVQQSSGSTETELYPIKQNPEFPARPAKDLTTPAQQAFWDYIETFNRLPDNPTEVQKEIFATRGEAPQFKVISTSPKSVFNDVEGMRRTRKFDH